MLKHLHKDAELKVLLMDSYQRQKVIVVDAWGSGRLRVPRDSYIVGKGVQKRGAHIML